MSDGYRNGAFALGLVVGGGIAINLFLWLDNPSNQGKRTHGPSSQDAQDGQEAALWWWRWTGDLISFSDTLAQWIMAFFTICATVVLIFTLRSANKTNSAAIKASNAALEANQIMRAEQRPWVHFEVVGATSARIFETTETSDLPHYLGVLVDCKMVNTGTVPAGGVVFDVTLGSIPEICDAERQEVFVDRNYPSGRSIPPNSSVNADLWVMTEISPEFLADGSVVTLQIIVRSGYRSPVSEGDDVFVTKQVFSIETERDDSRLLSPKDIKEGNVELRLIPMRSTMT